MFINHTFDRITTGRKKMILSLQKRSGTFWSQKSAIFLSLVFDRRFERCCPPQRVHRCTFDRVILQDHGQIREMSRSSLTLDVETRLLVNCWDTPLGELLRLASWWIVETRLLRRRGRDNRPPYADRFSNNRRQPAIWQKTDHFSNWRSFRQPTIARKTTKAEKDKFPNIIIYDYQMKFVCLLNFGLFFSD